MPADRMPERDLSLIAETIRATEEAAEQSSVARPGRALALLALVATTLSALLIVEWPHLTGQREQELVTETAAASLPIVAHSIEDYAGVTGRLPASLDSLGLGDSGLLYQHADSTYVVALLTPAGDTVAFRGIVHLQTGGQR